MTLSLPNGIHVRADRSCYKIPKWCLMIGVIRSRSYVAAALLELRRCERLSRA